MNLICKFFGHKIVAYEELVYCMRCGKMRRDIEFPIKGIKRNILGQVKKAEIVKRVDEVEEELNKIS